MPEGFEGITVTGVSGDNKLQLTLAYVAGSNIPASTGLIVKGKGTAMFDVSTAASSQSGATGNMLRGTDKQETFKSIANERYYRLSRNSQGELGFFYGTTGGKSFENGAHEAYLAVPLKDSYFFGYVLDSVSTGITNVATESQSQSKAVYTLDGVRISGDGVDGLRPGIYIVNGKKIVVR